MADAKRKSMSTERAKLSRPPTPFAPASQVPADFLCRKPAGFDDAPKDLHSPWCSATAILAAEWSQKSCVMLRRDTEVKNGVVWYKDRLIFSEPCFTVLGLTTGTPLAMFYVARFDTLVLQNVYRAAGWSHERQIHRGGTYEATEGGLADVQELLDGSVAYGEYTANARSDKHRDNHFGRPGTKTASGFIGYESWQERPMSFLQHFPRVHNTMGRVYMFAEETDADLLVISLSTLVPLKRDEYDKPVVPDCGFLESVNRPYDRRRDVRKPGRHVVT